MNRRTLLLITGVLAVAVTGGCGRGGYEVRIEGFGGSADSAEVTLTMVLGEGDKLLDPEVVEESDRVMVTVRARADGGDHDSLGLPTQHKVRLDRPLGDRTVVDGGTGKPVPKES